MKKLLFIIIGFIILILLVFFIKSNYKLFSFGNNIINKSADKIEKNILNISSYELTAQITIHSNKNVNSYLVKQSYIKQQNIMRQEIIEPENLKGVSFFYDGTNLKIKNTKLNLVKIYENYNYIGDNNLFLSSFIEDYESDEESKIIKTDEETMMEAKIKNNNKYNIYKKLYVNNESKMPTKMEIKDITQNTVVYILYNEVKINNLHKEDILAFKLNIKENDI